MKKMSNYKNLPDLQLAILRIYIGIDFIHHFSEKFGLLGFDAKQNVMNYFTSIGMSSTLVIVAGLCEFVAFLCFTFGILTRCASLFTFFYLIVSLFAGHHYHAGFTWANSVNNIMINGKLQVVNGGWEYPLLWAIVCLSFVITGGRKWSLDSKIRLFLKNNPKKITPSVI
ncbi:DoxX family protein [Piscirickettsia salmonis]|uniref:DoxX family protein n=2 Tax=Piscirickettsia salmonis TaxID=1238 RepID=UPI001E403937|nr:DoxX family protein [Piscirickettsia salmonis]